MKRRKCFLLAVIAAGLSVVSAWPVMAGMNMTLVEQCWEELEQTERRSAELYEEGQGDLTQIEMNQNSWATYQLWDDEINVLWGHLKELLDEDTMHALTQDEIQWIQEKEAAIQAEGEPYGNGTIRPLVENSLGAELTRERVYVLMGYLPAPEKQSVSEETPAENGISDENREASFPTLQSAAEHEAMYGAVLNSYYGVLRNDFYHDWEEVPDPFPEYVNPSVLSLSRLTEGYKLFYAYADINADGKDELLLYGGREPDMGAYVDVYGYDGDSPIHFWSWYDLGERVYLSLYETGIMEVRWSDSASDSGYDFYLPEGSGYALDSISTHGDIEDVQKINYYHSMGKDAPITEDEFYSIYQQYTSASQAQLAWQAF